MKYSKNFIQFKQVETYNSFKTLVETETETLDAALTSETPLLHTFLPTDNKVIISVSNEKKLELGLTSNIIREEKLSGFPFGWSHQYLVNYVDMFIGSTSVFQTLTDAVNFAAATIELNSTDKITIVKLEDRKFTNKIYYVISTSFSNSDFLSIPNIITGDAAAGSIVATTLPGYISLVAPGSTGSNAAIF